MTDWLDQLRRLDHALASGEITAAQHRSRRDEILAEASSVQPRLGSPQQVPGPGPFASVAPPNQHHRPASWPVAPPEAQVTPGQAQAIFSAAQTAPRKPWLVSLVVLLVLAIIAAGLWLWMISDSDDPVTPRTPPVAEFTELRLPGTGDVRSGEMRLSEARAANLITAEETALLVGLDVTKVTYVGSADRPYQYLAFSYPSTDPAGQTERIRAVQRDLGFTPVSRSGLPAGVEAVEFSNTRAAQVRLTYTSASATVQLIVLQVPLGEPDELLERGRDVVSAATAVAPPA